MSGIHRITRKTGCGVIIGTQVMMILLVLLITQLRLDTFDIVLLINDGIVLLVTAIILRLRKKDLDPIHPLVQ